MPLSSHTAWVPDGGGTLSMSQPESGKELCEPVPSGTLGRYETEDPRGVRA